MFFSPGDFEAGSTLNETRNVHQHRRLVLGVLPCLSPVFLLFAGCQKPQPLPEQGTYAHQLYVERCGACHRPYSPVSMTAAMWEVQLEAMRSKIAQAGQPPLSSEQYLTILDYLKRNAGKQ